MTPYDHLDDAAVSIRNGFGYDAEADLSSASQ